MVQVKDLTELTVRDLWQEVKGEDDWRGDLKGQTKRLVKRSLESSMDEEILEELRVDRCRRGQLHPRRHANVCSMLTELAWSTQRRQPGKA